MLDQWQRALRIATAGEPADLVFQGGRAPDKSIVGVFKAGDVDSLARAVTMDGIARITAETDEYIELSVVEKNAQDDSVG